MKCIHHLMTGADVSGRGQTGRKTLLGFITVPVLSAHLYRYPSIYLFDLEA